MRVFLADDAAFIRELMKSFFHKAGHHIVGEAENGEEVVAMVGKSLPDLLVVDLVMPLLNGVDALKIIRPQYPEMKVIVCTTLDESIAVDPQLYDAKLTKPFTNDQFRKILEDFGVSKGA